MRRNEVATATRILTAPPRPVSLSPDLSRLLLFSKTPLSARLEVVDIATGDILSSYTFQSPQPSPVPAWSPNGEKILFVEVVEGAYQLRVWDLNSSKAITPKALVSKNIHGQQWNAAGDRILHFVHPRDDPRSWREGGRALYWVDPNGVEEPQLFVAELGQSYHKAYSGDGRLAVVNPSDATRENLLRIRGVDGVWKSLTLDRTSEIGQISWSGAETLLMSVRRAGSEFYGIEEIDLRNGSVRRIASDSWDLSAASYLWEGHAMRHVVNVDGVRRTRICRVSDWAECEWLGPEGVGSTVLATYAEGDSAYMLYSGPVAPPSVHRIDLRTGIGDVVWAPHYENMNVSQAGVSLNVLSEDGLRIPAYYWKSKRDPTKEAAVLIHIPGGPGLQGVPVWEPYIQYLTSRGVDVIYMNYRGQTGYGVSYEKAAGELEARADELMKVRDYAINQLGIPQERVILYGHSYGGTILMRAAVREKLAQPMILASAIPDGAGVKDTHERCVVAFHGDADLIIDAENARKAYLSTFGEGALAEPCGHFQTFADEGHVYEAPLTYATIFAAAIRMLD